MRDTNNLLRILQNYKNLKITRGIFLTTSCVFIKKNNIEAFLIYKKRDNENDKKETEIAIFYNNKKEHSGGGYGIFVKDEKDEEIIRDMMKKVFNEKPINTPNQLTIFDFITE